MKPYSKSSDLSMRYFQFDSIQKLQMIVEIRCCALNYEDVHFFIRVLRLSEGVTCVC